MRADGRRLWSQRRSLRPFRAVSPRAGRRLYRRFRRRLPDTLRQLPELPLQGRLRDVGHLFRREGRLRGALHHGLQKIEPMCLRREMYGRWERVHRGQRRRLRDVGGLSNGAAMQRHWRRVHDPVDRVPDER